MSKLLIAASFVLLASATIFGQENRTPLQKIREIKLLESSRDDVKKLLVEYEASDDEDYSQNFSNDDIDIDVSYSSGKCAEDADDVDDTETWKVGEWKVTKLKIRFSAAVKLKDIGLDVSKFTKEQRYEDEPETFVLYSKVLGLALDVDEDGVESVSIFPAKDQSKKLCSKSTAAKDFYSKDGKFVKSAFDHKDTGCINLPANVEGLDLSAAEIQASFSKLISVSTTAVDAENDVLTYQYIVTRGQIRGTGAKVIWDLTTAGPGTYTITAGVDDGCGICGKTVTKSVTIK